MCPLFSFAFSYPRQFWPKGPKIKGGLKNRTESSAGSCKSEPHWLPELKARNCLVGYLLLGKACNLCVAVVSSVGFWDKQLPYATYSLELCGFYRTCPSVVKGICKREGRAGTLNLGSMGELLCRVKQYLTFQAGFVSRRSGVTLFIRAEVMTSTTFQTWGWVCSFCFFSVAFSSYSWMWQK